MIYLNIMKTLNSINLLRSVGNLLHLYFIEVKKTASKKNVK